MSKRAKYIHAGLVVVGCLYFSVFTVLKTSYHIYSATGFAPDSLCSGRNFATACTGAVIMNEYATTAVTRFEPFNTVNLIVVPALAIVAIGAVVVAAQDGKQR